MSFNRMSVVYAPPEFFEERRRVRQTEETMKPYPPKEEKHVYCTACGEQIPEKSVFCLACGRKVETPPKMKKCFACDYINEVHYNFCKACGADLSDPDAYKVTPGVQGQTQMTARDTQPQKEEISPMSDAHDREVETPKQKQVQQAGENQKECPICGALVDMDEFLCPICGNMW